MLRCGHELDHQFRPSPHQEVDGSKDGGRDTPENLWKKCPACGEMIFHRDLVANLYVCPNCGHHMRIGPAERFAYTFDRQLFQRIAAAAACRTIRCASRARRRYADEMKAAKAKTGRPEAFTAARGTIDGLPVMVAVQPFDFLGGSLGMAVGEAFVQAVEAAVAEKRAFILFVSSGGARMQESMLSLMQMPRTTIAVDMLREAGLPYIVVLTDPTFGGVRPPMPCWAISRSPNRARRSALPARASSPRPSAKNCRKVSSAPNICSTMACWTW